MKRIAYLSPYPYQKARSLTASKKFYIVTPTPQTARSLRVPHHSLEALAIQTLGKNGLAVAPALIASRILRGAAAEVISTTDIEGTSRVFEPTLKELLQAGNWQQEGNSSSPSTDSNSPLTPISLQLEFSSRKRFEQLARLAKTYRERLGKRNLIDPAEIFWQAAALLPERRSQSLFYRESLFLYGYHFPRPDELAFVDALAGDESILLLAGIDRPLFVENQKVLQWLKQKGWQVEVSDATPQTLGERAAEMFLDSSSVAQFSSEEEVNLQKANPQDIPQDIPHDLPLAHTYPHLEAEVRGVLARVKTLLSEQIAPNDIAIVARDETLYGPTILDIAWEYEVPVRALYAIPLKTTRFGAWVQALGETILAGLPFEQTLKVLAHPLCGGLAPEIWPQVRKLHPSSLQAWQDMGVDLSILSWPQKDTRANWVQRLQDVFSFWNLRRRASRWAREAVAYYKFLEGLVSLSEPEIEILSLAQFVEQISQLLSLSRVPAAPGRGGVELHAPISLTGARYRHVFVLGVAEGLLPAPVRQDPVLDFRDRQVLAKFGIPLAGLNTAGQEALSFWAVCLAASESLTLSYPRLIERNETLASPYLSQLGLKPEAAPPLPVASIESSRKLSLRTSSGNKDNKQAKVVGGPLWQVRENKRTRVGSYFPEPTANIAPRSGKKGADGMPLDFPYSQDKPDLQDKVLPQAYHAWEVEQGRESSDLPDEYDGIIGIPLDPSEREFSASQLVNLGQCPFKWFADKILSLGELEEAEEQLSPSLRGRLYHKTLELALTWALGEKCFEAQLSEANLDRDDLEVNLAAEGEMAIAAYDNYTDRDESNDTALTTQELRQGVLANLENAFLEAEKLEKLPALPAWEASREEHLTVLRRTVLASDFLQEEAQVLSTEKKFQGEWYGLKVRGFVDRIDRTDEGLAIVDYKTSSTAPKGAKDLDGKANLDIQLPLYVQVAAKEFISGGEQIANAYYYSLIKSKILKKADIDEEALAQFAERVKLQLETGHFPVEPDIDRIACRYCPYDLVCRQGTRLSRK